MRKPIVVPASGSLPKLDRIRITPDVGVRFSRSATVGRVARPQQLPSPHVDREVAGARSDS